MAKCVIIPVTGCWLLAARSQQSGWSRRQEASNQEQQLQTVKRYIALTLIFLLLTLPQQVCSADSGYQVKWVVDGDTVVLDDERRVRYIGINAPELEHDGHQAEPFAEEAKQFNVSL